MQMLAAGGAMVVGSFPDYEVPQAAGWNDALDADWLRTIPGRALKLLDPHRMRLPRGIPFKAIWLNRNHREQARSQAKFGNAMMGLPRTRRVISRRKRTGPAPSARSVARCRLTRLFRTTHKSPRSSFKLRR